MNEFLLLLLNIRTLFCNGQLLAHQITEEKTMYPWSDSIEYITEYSGKSITYNLLLFRICPNLITIDVIDLYSKIIPLLKNVTALRNFALSHSSITFGDLDTIHENIPRLGSFAAHSVVPTNFEFSQNMNPATSLTECHFDKVKTRSLETRNKLLAYVSKKHLNLSTFTYAFLPEYLNNDRVERLTGSDWRLVPQNLEL